MSFIQSSYNLDYARHRPGQIASTSTNTLTTSGVFDGLTTGNPGFIRYGHAVAYQETSHNSLVVNALVRRNPILLLSANTTSSSNTLVVKGADDRSTFLSAVPLVGSLIQIDQELMRINAVGDITATTVNLGVARHIGTSTGAQHSADTPVYLLNHSDHPAATNFIGIAGLDTTVHATNPRDPATPADAYLDKALIPIVRNGVVAVPVTDEVKAFDSVGVMIGTNATNRGMFTNAYASDGVIPVPNASFITPSYQFTNNQGDDETRLALVSIHLP